MARNRDVSSAEGDIVPIVLVPNRCSSFNPRPWSLDKGFDGILMLARANRGKSTSKVDNPSHSTFSTTCQLGVPPKSLRRRVRMLSVVRSAGVTELTSGGEIYGHKLIGPMVIEPEGRATGSLPSSLDGNLTCLSGGSSSDKYPPALFDLELHWKSSHVVDLSYLGGRRSRTNHLLGIQLYNRRMLAGTCMMDGKACITFLVTRREYARTPFVRCLRVSPREQIGADATWE